MKIAKKTDVLSNKIVNSFEVLEVVYMECEDIRIDEFDSHYELIVKKEEKLDKFDLASVLFEFLHSEFFSKEKYFLFGESKIYFNEKEDYNVIFAKVEPIFKRNI